jgi:hypothetical protein
MVHRSAFEAIRDKYGPTWFSKVTQCKGRTFSEDLSSSSARPVATFR